MGLRYKRWDEISTEFLDYTCSPCLLAPEAYAAFVPAYLLHALDDLEARHSVVVELTVYSLCPEAERSNRVSRKVGLMTPAQIQAIRES